MFEVARRKIERGLYHFCLREDLKTEFGFAVERLKVALWQNGSLKF